MQIDDQTPSQENPQDRLRSAEEECERLRKENVRLRKMLGIPGVSRRRNYCAL